MVPTMTAAALLMLCAAVFTPDCVSAKSTPVFGSEFIFPPHPLHNHSSSIVEAPNGDLLVTWYRGSGERWADDVMIMGSRKPPGAESWEEPWTKAGVESFPDTNPILFIDARGTLWLFWAQVLNNEWWSTVLRYRTSTDYDGPGPPRWDWQDDVWMVMHEDFTGDIRDAMVRGREELARYDSSEQARWNDRFDQRERNLEDKMYRRLGWMPRTSPMMIGESRLLVPLYNGSFGAGLMAITEDWGKTWRASRPLAGISSIQPAIVRKDDGTLVAYMRDGSPHLRVHRSESPDGGMTWTPAVPTGMPNPGSSVEVIRLANGNWVMVDNDVGHYKGRFRLAVRVSTDEGETWSAARYLENRLEPEQGDPIEFSYPSVMQTADGLIHVSYTWRDNEYGETIKHAWFEEAWITEAE